VAAVVLGGHLRLARVPEAVSLALSFSQHTSAYVSIRQHTSGYGAISLALAISLSRSLSRSLPPSLPPSSKGHWFIQSFKNTHSQRLVGPISRKKRTFVTFYLHHYLSRFAFLENARGWEMNQRFDMIQIESQSTPCIPKSRALIARSALLQ
jgi:hypothetical protein